MYDLTFNNPDTYKSAVNCRIKPHLYTEEAQPQSHCFLHLGIISLNASADLLLLWMSSKWQRMKRNFKKSADL